MNWIPIKSKTPPDPSYVLVRSPGQVTCLVYENGQFVDTSIATYLNIDISNITHWMPIPDTKNLK